LVSYKTLKCITRVNGAGCAAVSLVLARPRTRRKWFSIWLLSRRQRRNKRPLWHRLQPTRSVSTDFLHDWLVAVSPVSLHVPLCVIVSVDYKFCFLFFFWNFFSESGISESGRSALFGCFLIFSVLGFLH